MISQKDLDSDKNDKLAGRAPATKAGNTRVVQKTSRSRNNSTNIDKNLPADKAPTVATPIANIGGLGGIIPDLSKKEDQLENEEELKENVGKNASKFNLAEKKNTGQVSNANFPKNQVNHKPLQKTINQPR